MNQEGLPKNKYFGKLLIVLAILIVIGLGGWYVSHRHNNNLANSSTAPGWSHYNSKKYGFEFDYLTAWGTPNVVATNQGQGKEYDVFFNKVPPDLNHVAKLRIDSSSAVNSCQSEANCRQLPTITKSYIQQQLKDNRLNFIGKGQDKFATLDQLATGSNTYVLAVYRAQDLSKLNASAAVGYYAKKVAKGCPTTDVSYTNTDCIDKTDFDNLNKSIISIKAL